MGLFIVENTDHLISPKVFFSEEVFPSAVEWPGLSKSSLSEPTQSTLA